MDGRWRNWQGLALRRPRYCGTTAVHSIASDDKRQSAREVACKLQDVEGRRLKSIVKQPSDSVWCRIGWRPNRDAIIRVRRRLNHCCLCGTIQSLLFSVPPCCSCPSSRNTVSHILHIHIDLCTIHAVSDVRYPLWLRRHGTSGSGEPRPGSRVQPYDLLLLTTTPSAMYMSSRDAYSHSHLNSLHNRNTW